MIAAPFCAYRDTVRAEWVGAGSQHMDLDRYVALFQCGSLALFEALGISGTAQTPQGHGCFAAETHLLYEREMREGDVATVRTTILNADAKRLHLAHEMYRGDEPGRTCLQEIMFINVDLTSRRSTAWSPPAWQRIADALARHNELPRPAKTGRAIGFGKV